MTDILHDRAIGGTVRRSRAAARGAGARHALGSAWPAALFCVLAVGAWEGMARATGNPLVPHVDEIGTEIARILTDGLAPSQILITLARIGGGLLVASILACAIGFVSVRSRFARAFVEPAVVLGLTVPGLVWALLCVIWFGIGFAAPVTAIALGVAPALVLHVAQGLRAVDDELLEMAQVFAFPFWTGLRAIWLPSLVPFAFSGLRLGFSLSWKVIVLVELFGLSNGVGYQLNAEFGAQNVAGVLAWTIVFWLVMTFIEYGLLQVLERRATRWRHIDAAARARP